MNSFIFKFFYSLKTFAWKILHGRVKARPSGQNAPVTKMASRAGVGGRSRPQKQPEDLRREGRSLLSALRRVPLSLCIDMSIGARGMSVPANGQCVSCSEVRVTSGSCLCPCGPWYWNPGGLKGSSPAMVECFWVLIRATREGCLKKESKIPEVSYLVEREN